MPRMPRLVKIVLAIFIIFIIGGILFNIFSSQPKKTNSEIKFAATIFPLYDILREIVGGRREVILILPPGASPHTFEPSPRLIQDLSQTAVVFQIGHNLDDWVLKAKNSLPQTKFVVVDKGIALQGDEEEGVNPHYWLSFKNAKIIASNILETLNQIDPQNKDFYEKNFQDYLVKLDEGDRKVREILAPLSNRQIVTFHDAFSYFAADYNLNILATFEPFPGKEPTPKYLEELKTKIDQYQVKVLFLEPQMSQSILKQIAADWKINLYVLDPLGGLENRQNFIQLMLYNAQTIRNALQK